MGRENIRGKRDDSYYCLTGHTTIYPSTQHSNPAIGFYSIFRILRQDNIREDKIMAKLNGKTPEEMAQDHVQEISTELSVKIDGLRGMQLEEIIRYRKAKQIYSKGEKWFQDNLEFFRKEYLESIIDAQYTQRQKQDAAQEEKDKLEYFKLLVSRGVERFKALEMAGL